MDLIDDLGNDLALAFLVEKRHSHKIDKKGVVDLIGRVKEVLEPVSEEEEKARAAGGGTAHALNTAH